MTTRTLSVRLSLGEWRAFHELCARNNVTYQDMFRSIIVDALLEEGYDALRRREPKGHTGSTETCKGSGAATP